MRLWLSERGLARLDFPCGNAAAAASWARRQFGNVELLEAAASDLAETAIRQLAEYFAGSRRRFELALDLRGTPFQLAVWREVAAIPWGATCSYHELARRIGRPSAVRAVGAANGANPLSIIIPCHRLVGTDGRLHGYGGGIERKAQLLALEGIAPYAALT